MTMVGNLAVAVVAVVIGGGDGSGRGDGGGECYFGGRAHGNDGNCCENTCKSIYMKYRKHYV